MIPVKKVVNTRLGFRIMISVAMMMEMGILRDGVVTLSQPDVYFTYLFYNLLKIIYLNFFFYKKYMNFNEIIHIKYKLKI